MATIPSFETLGYREDDGVAWVTLDRPERKNAAQRMADGIPIGAGLFEKVRAIAAEHNAPWMLN